MQENTNILIAKSKTMMLAILGLIVLIILILLYATHTQQQSTIETVIDEEKAVAKRIYLQTFDSFIGKYEAIASNIILNNEVINAFERRDRKKLLELTLPTYKQLQKDNPFLQIFHFHTPKTSSFLRVHKPEKFGDDLSDIRHMINRVNKDHMNQIGLEVGRYGIHYRVALPVFNKKEKFLGTFELGINIEYIINIFRNVYGFNTKLLFKKDIFDIFFKSYKQVSYSEYSDEYNQIDLTGCCDNSEQQNGIEFKVNIIKDTNNNTIGRILFSKDIGKYTNNIEKIHQIVVITSIVLILLFMYMLRNFFFRFTKLINNYEQQLLDLSNIDFLTQIKNRRYITKVLESEIERSKRYKHSLSVVLFDIDNFKLINDEYGHNIGDDVLKTLSNIVSTHIRQSDCFGRWGGEEFILIFTETPLDVAYDLTEKIREKIASYDFNGLKVSCSFGITELLDEDSLKSMIHNADMALYDSKHNGKNKVTIFNDQEEIR